jgi:hypothetical protein
MALDSAAAQLNQLVRKILDFLSFSFFSKTPPGRRGLNRNKITRP